MDKIEQLMAKYPDINFYFEPMPIKLGGIAIENQVTINSKKSKTEQFQWLLEEIGHVKTSVGDISDYDSLSNMKQEHEARTWGFKQQMTRSQLDKLRKCYAENDYELADDLGIQVDYLHEVGQSYGLHYKHVR
ncbi:hypothetical protein RXV91_01240 [Lactiplantibacillus sp. DA1]|nr:ImmA/IrrE family metallo-endopeptidase [Lactiplantibacillus sp. DA1]MDV0429505.1 hypothetical protein [Lactiplantibacillus sp. DA1]